MIDHPEVPQYDLSNCDAEPIHTPNSIQPHGVLLVLNEPDLVIWQISDNTEAIFGKKPIDLLGKSVETLLGNDQIQILTQVINVSDPSIYNPIEIQIPAKKQILTNLVLENEKTETRYFDAIVHRNVDGHLILELEPVGSRVATTDAFQRIQHSLTSLQATASVISLCQIAVKELRQLLGFDRVMAYRFDDQWNGEVIAEAYEPDMESFLGLFYPASDIPEQARRLYVQNRIRLITNSLYSPARMLRLRDFNGSLTDDRPIDMTYSVLRSVSPIHCEYLQNMGVGASMSISIILDNQLWGLVACHHRKPKYLPYDLRAIGEFFAQLLTLQLASKIDTDQYTEMMQSKNLISQLLGRFSYNQPLGVQLVGTSPNILDLVHAGGAAVFTDGEIFTVGQTPSSQEIKDLVKWLSLSVEEIAFATNQLSEHWTEGVSFQNIASGILAISLSKPASDYILWFRPEVSQIVMWGGNPNKSVTQDSPDVRLSPRKSFQAWKEVIRGKSLKWQTHEIATVTELRTTIMDVMLRIAEEKLKQKYIEELEMQNYLKVLHEVTLELAQTQTLDDFYRKSVELGVKHFRFDRIELWLYDAEIDIAKGLYSAQASQTINDIHHLRFKPSDLLKTSEDESEYIKNFVFKENTQLFPTLYRDQGEAFTGWLAAAALFDNNLIGWLIIDNFLSHQPAKKIQLEILKLYALTLGSLLVRKRHEDALLTLSRRLEMATHVGKIGIWDVNLRDRTMVFDDQVADMFGIKPTERFEYEKDLRIWMNLFHPDDQYITKTLTESLAHKNLLEIEYRIIHPDNTIRFMKSRATLIHGDQKKPDHLVGISMDITERKDSERALEQALEKEKELGNLKSRFVSMASHEFRTPLASILSAAETILRFRTKMSEDDVEKRIHKIRHQVLHMRNIMEDILQLARIQAGVSFDFKPESADLDKLIRDIIDEFEHPHQKEHRIIYNRDRLDLTMIFDERLVRHIVSNLLSNALKYSPPEEYVDLSVNDQTEEVLIRITDKGIGIPAEEIEYLFVPFHRAKNTGTIPGTGLGLTITKAAIEAHGGTISVSSKLNQGTVITITLPKNPLESRE